MKRKYKEEVQEALQKISENANQNRPLSEEELSILFLAAFFEEEANESN